jgi:hypothetical protein
MRSQARFASAIFQSTTDWFLRAHDRMMSSSMRDLRSIKILAFLFLYHATMRSVVHWMFMINSFIFFPRMSEWIGVIPPMPIRVESIHRPENQAVRVYVA